MFSLNLITLSRLYNVTMVVNLIMPSLALSFLLKVSPYGCPALTPPSKMAKPSACFAPSTMSFAPSFSKPPCPHLTGLMLLPPPPSSSIISPPKPFVGALPTLPSMALFPPITTCARLDARAILISLPPPPQTCSPLYPVCVPRLLP
jgi:hypothetical protein